MTEDVHDERDQDLVARLALDPDLAARVLEAIDLVADDYTVADGALFARRFLEAELDAGPGGLGEWVLREAAGALFACGYDDEAQGLRAVADTSGALDQASADWHARLLVRPVTAAERAARALFDAGQVRLLDGPDGVQGTLGADGARYTPAALTSPDGTSARAVIVTTHAGTAEVVTGFSTGLDHVAWLGDRMSTTRGDPAAGGFVPGRPRAALPLASCTDGPDCRTAREERALAGLLHGNPGADGLSARSFSTCTRTEIYLAWHDAADAAHVTGNPSALADAVRDELARRLLCAPAWAAPLTGWPFGDRALEYYDRLAVTPVTPAQALAASRALVAEDEQARAAARVPAPCGPGARRAAPCRPSPLTVSGPAAALLNQHRPADPDPGGPVRLL